MYWNIIVRADIDSWLPYQGADVNVQKNKLYIAVRLSKLSCGNVVTLKVMSVGQ